jgi:hypothetical protein
MGGQRRQGAADAGHLVERGAGGFLLAEQACGDHAGQHAIARG